jgi:hypothetical protein
MMKKRRISTGSRSSPFRRRANRRRLIALLVISVIAFVLLWLISFLYDYQVDFYEPRDGERIGGR